MKTSAGYKKLEERCGKELWKRRLHGAWTGSLESDKKLGVGQEAWSRTGSLEFGQEPCMGVGQEACTDSDKKPV